MKEIAGEGVEPRRGRNPQGHESVPRLQKLDMEQVVRIDELLASVGDYGEVHLVVQHGQLRYINRVESHKAWKGHNTPHEKDQR